MTTRAAHTESENVQIPAPPLPPWIAWLWKLLDWAGLRRAVTWTIAAVGIALAIPLVTSAILIACELLGDRFPILETSRRAYLAVIHDGFEVLHNRIDYVHSFQIELTANSPKRPVVKDIELGQFAELVIEVVKVVPQDKCSLAKLSHPPTEPPTVLRTLLGTVPIRSDIAETGERMVEHINEKWWVKNIKQVSSTNNGAFALELQAVDLAKATEPEGCAVLTVIGKVKIFKNRTAALPK